MTLNKANVPVPLGLGVNTKVDPKQLAGSFLVMENARMTRTGEVRKRNGYQALGTSILGSSIALSNGLKATNFNRELLLIDRRSLYSYVAEADTWSNKGPCPTTSVTTAAIVSNSFEQTNPDVCISRNTATYAWEDSRGGIRGIVVDQDSGARVLQDTQLSASGIRPRCFAVGQYHFVFYVEGTNLLCRRVDVASPSSFGAANTIASDIHATVKHFDVCLVGTSRMVVAYRNTAGQLKVAYVQLTGLVGGLSDGVPPPTALSTLDPDGCLTIISGAEQILGKDVFHLAWFNTTTGVHAATYYADFTVANADTVIDASVSPSVRNITGVAYISGLTGQSRLDLFWERDAATDINHYIERSNITLSSFSASPVAEFQRAAGLISKAYRDNEATRVNVSYASAEGLQDTLFNLSDASQLFAEGWGYNWGFGWGGYGATGQRSVIQAKMLATVAGGHTSRASQLAGVWATANEVEEAVVLFAALRKTRVVADNVNTFTLRGLNQITLNHAPNSVGQPAQLGQNLHIPGGFLKSYDGESVVEHGFHLYPDSVTSAEASGGSIAHGTYQHVVVWEWIDAKGQVHRSAPSLPVSITVSGGSKKVDITIPALRYTAKTAPARAEVVASVYRTTAGGSLFYKVSSDASPLYNDPTTDTIVFSDTLADASITSRPLLYTTGGTLENTPVSACDVVAAWKNRLFAAGLESESQLRYSKEFVTDEGVNFSDALTISANSGGGGVRVIAVLDEKLVLFKESQIFVLVGEGPTDTGAQNDYGAPQQVATDVGCSEPESMVLTPKGLMFKSEKGIYLLDRALNVSYVGDRVQQFNALNITSSVLVADVNQVRFTTAEGTTLVYDYYYDAWSTYTNQTAVSATNWRGTYVYIREDGQALQEQDGLYTDAGSPIRTRLETSWIQVAGFQGFQRLYKLLLLGDYVGEHTLRTTLYYDFEPYSRETFTIQPSSTVVGGVFGSESPYGSGSFGGGTGVYQFEMKPARQKCQAVKLLVEDLFPNGTGTGSFSLSGLTAVLGVKGGTRRMPDGATMSGSGGGGE